MSEADLAALLHQSKVNNQKSGITGLLLYREGLFMQLLEGPEDAVRACYARIGSDPRHRDVLLLVEKTTRERLFSDWAMAFEHIRSAVNGERMDVKTGESDGWGFSSFLERPYAHDELGQPLNEGLFLLLSFKKNTAHWRQYHSREVT